MELPPKTTWSQIKLLTFWMERPDGVWIQQRYFDLIVDPVYGKLCELEEFEQHYPNTVAELNGAGNYPDSYLNHFLTPMITHRNALNFCGDDEIADFIDIAEELGDISTRQEINEGLTISRQKLKTSKSSIPILSNKESKELAEDLHQAEKELEQEEKQMLLDSRAKQKEKRRKRQQTETPYTRDYRFLKSWWKIHGSTYF